MKLEVELVPMQLWGTSIASRFTARWNVLRRECYLKAGYRCEICGGRGPAHPVEAHEVWEYEIDDQNKTACQRLVRLIALCPMCHRFKHFGRSRRVLPTHELEALLDHSCKVNQCERNELDEHIMHARLAWNLRNTYKWTQDLSIFLETAA